MMKRILITFAGLMSCALAQTKDYVGKWELCMIVTAKGDTEHVRRTDARYLAYNFEYNNTFTSFTKDKEGEASGRWGFDFENKTIKIKNPVYVVTRQKIGDYGIAIEQVTPGWFSERKEEGKKKFSYWVYCRVK
jgi:hypothetical protein